mmetsp:Transcript_9382/g.13911  ORF Transcript_9382/g.13911 Transcript_9382/m.13911 type:complete len:565 (+) Transcript_9382:10-1704(+)
MSIEQQAADVFEYDPVAICRSADAKWKANDLEGAVLVYQSALLNWGDDAMTKTDLSADAKEDLKSGIASLYVGYANLYRKAKQYKSCEEAYIAATNDPVVGSMGRIWLDYARFCEERGRYKAAQGVYLRALAGDAENDKEGGAVTDFDEQELLWEEFHRMMSMLEDEEGDDTDNNELTLEQLKEAVKTEHLGKIQRNKRKATESPDGYLSKKPMPSSPTSMEDNTPLALQKPIATKSTFSGAQLELLISSLNTFIESNSKSMLAEINSFPPELSAAWIARDGSSSPCHVIPFFQAKPPSMGATASGKDIVGVPVALEIVKLLLKNVGSNTDSEGFDIGSVVLDLCKSCWAMTAIKELERTKRMDSLARKMREGLASLDSENARNAFIANCEHQHNEYLDFYAWESRKLLAAQQQLFTKANIPCFGGISVDDMDISIQRNVCSVLHSAFILRDKVGRKAHIALLRSNEKKLAKELTEIPAQSQASMQQQNQLMQGNQQYFSQSQQQQLPYNNTMVFPIQSGAYQPNLQQQQQFMGQYGTQPQTGFMPIQHQQQQQHHIYQHQQYY